MYNHLVLRHAKFVLFLIAAAIIFFSSFIPKFKLDASAESLVLEHDAALKYYRKMNERFTSDDFLIVTFEPLKPLSDLSTLDVIKKLRDEVLQVPGVLSVTNLLDVPLLTLKPLDLTSKEPLPTIASGNVNVEKALQEMQKSPLYRDLLISRDGKLTALQINFPRDEKYHELLQQRNSLRDKESIEGLTSAEKIDLESVSETFQKYSADALAKQQAIIAKIREIMARYRDSGTLYLGGIPMITSDMIDYVRSDLVIFGIGVIVLLMIMLAVFFGRIQWVALPMLCCVVTGTVMFGFLGLMDWRVTVISSNFISLLSITTLGLSVHLIVRYRELHAANPEESQEWLVAQTVKKMFIPCLYTALTTIIAFISLLVSNIRPVIDFGMIMTVGISVAFVIVFLLLPSCLILLPKSKAPILQNWSQRFILSFATIAQQQSWLIWSMSFLLLLVSIIGIRQLSVDNRFIDYFKESTEIFQGMLVIDKKLGGTTPLDIIIDKPAEEASAEIEDDFSEDGGKVYYWLNTHSLDRLAKINQFLEDLPETGKVMSLETLRKILDKIPGREPLNNFELAQLPQVLPQSVQDILLEPYYSTEHEELRINIRLIESDPNLVRQALFDKIEKFLINDMQFKPEQIHLTGMAILYNNMLQSLYHSQILTIGAVFLVIMLMFIVLFRSLLVSILAIIPNLLSAGFILGFMGVVHIPLDMMTITIAAITIGIAVDNTIHFIHRFKYELPKIQNYWETVRKCHRSIGRAMFYTSVSVITGFSILFFSNFNPTVYFGLLTGLAMIIALCGALTLLPLLIVTIKPFKLKT